MDLKQRMIASLRGNRPLGVSSEPLKTPAQVLREATPREDLRRHSPAEELRRHRPSAILHDE